MLAPGARHSGGFIATHLREPDLEIHRQRETWWRRGFMRFEIELDRPHSRIAPPDDQRKATTTHWIETGNSLIVSTAGPAPIATAGQKKTPPARR